MFSDCQITRENSVYTFMGLFDIKYLSATHIRGFDKYKVLISMLFIHTKYSCIDNSPISVYISHPFWNWLVNFYPRTWAPNMLTLTGWALVMGCFLLESILDYDITSNTVGSKNPIPNWFWLVASICTWLGYTLDGTDGKQARRIGASGPTGELFDHGLDSWSTVPFTITIFSVFGRGEFSVSPIHLLCVVISVQVVFIVTHWEKYNTGVLFLSWGYDASQYGLVFVYLFTYFVGYEWYKFYIIGDFSFANTFETGFYLCCLGSLIMSGYNMWYSYSIDKTFKQANIYEGIRPIFPCITLFGISLFWATYSPTSIIDRDPRLFFFTMGTVFSNIACYMQLLLVSRSFSNSKFTLNRGVLGLSLWMPAFELFILRSSALLIVSLHVHYGICVRLSPDAALIAIEQAYMYHKSFTAFPL
uniref:Ethanolaminephosphotransferase 1 n=1 Tax=Heterorhabditis bacteriophora TaxID=37862 RepID=A0A1I7XCU6_HETBA